MRGIRFGYIARNLWVRRVTTVLTAGCMALVVYVFATVLMMSEGIRSTLVATGQPDNLMVLRRGASAEINSAVERSQAELLATLPGLASDTRGLPLASAETVVLINLPKRSSGKPSNVTVRGTTAQALELRQSVHITQGRMFRPGLSEIVVGRAVADGFVGTEVGATLHFSGRDWLIVGRFDAGGSGFDSELWGDAEQMLQTFHRQAFSIEVLKLADSALAAQVIRAIADEPRLQLQAKPEPQFYAEQSESMVTFIKVLGLSLAMTFSIGAVAGAMITMFSAVAQRQAEIGTLRALGFRRSAVLNAFLIESMLLALTGGVVGLAAASAMQAVGISTTNFQTFSELAFHFVLTPLIAVETLVFALAMGLAGGFIPAWRAARLQIVDCLRAA